MAMTIGRSAIWAAILCGALLAPVAPALGDGGGFSAADLATKPVEELVRIEQRLTDILKNARPHSAEEARYLSEVRKNRRKVRAELEKRPEPPSATPAASSGTPAASSATPAASTPPTHPTPEPAASSCGQSGANCATPPPPPAIASAPPLAPTPALEEPKYPGDNATQAQLDEYNRKRRAFRDAKLASQYGVTKQ